MQREPEKKSPAELGEENSAGPAGHGACGGGYACRGQSREQSSWCVATTLKLLQEFAGNRSLIAAPEEKSVVPSPDVVMPDAEAASSER